MTSLDHAIHDARNAITVADSHEHDDVAVSVPVAALKWLVAAAENYRESAMTYDINLIETST